MATGPDPNQLIEARTASEDARRLGIFTERLFTRATPDYLQQTTPDQRLAMARAGLEFFSRRAQEVVVRVLPSAHDATVVETVMPDCAFIVDSML